MKVGDLVRFSRTMYGEYRLYLILERHKTWDWKRHSDTSPFAQWKIIDTQTGKVLTQNTRELETISEAG